MLGLFALILLFLSSSLLLRSDSICTVIWQPFRLFKWAVLPLHRYYMLLITQKLQEQERNHWIKESDLFPSVWYLWGHSVHLWTLLYTRLTNWSPVESHWGTGTQYTRSLQNWVVQCGKSQWVVWLLLFNYPASDFGEDRTRLIVVHHEKQQWTQVVSRYILSREW